jgi:DNA modification methylase
MVAVFREVWRVLRDDGTAWLNLGDSYTSGGRRTRDPGRSTKHQPFDGNRYRDGLRPSTPENLKAKDLVGIPWRVAFALQADGWYLRSDIIWAKPNPMPESVQDRPTRAHEYVFLLAKSPRYHYNADAVAQIPAASSVARLAQPGLPDQRGSNRVPGKTNGPMRACFGGRNKHAGYGGRLASGREDSGHYLTRGTNMRSVLAIGGAGFRGSHFAVMPERLAALCILAGCPEGGTVLDPFCGSGTTGVVAAKYGRRFVGIDISKEFCRMALKRMAPHLAQGGLFAPCGAAPGKVEAQ